MAAIVALFSMSSGAQPSRYTEALPESKSMYGNLVRQTPLRGEHQLFNPSRSIPVLPVGIPRAAAGNLPTLEGHVVYSDADANEQKIHPDGIYSFGADGTGFTKLSGENKIYGSFGAVWLDGYYYQSSLMEYTGGTWVYSMANYDTNTWNMIKYNTSVRPPSVASALVEVDGLVFGCFFSEWYTMGGTMVFGRMTMDMNQNYPVDVIATLPETMISMATDARGEIYGFGRSGNVYRIDKRSGEATNLGYSGVKPQYVSSAAFDNLTGKIYWNVSNAGGYIYEVEPSTGKASLVCQLPANDEIVGIRIPFRAAPKAPAAPQNISMSFAGGSLAGKVNFTIPSTSYDNVSATGTVNYIIRANGIQVAQGSSTYGASVSADVTLPAGDNYNIAVVLYTEAGYGPKTIVSQFIGHDTPSAPEVTAAWSDGSFKVKWNSVKSTINGGYMDPSKVTYSVLRMPDSIMVATSLTDTTYTEPVAEPDNYTIYSYRVFASCNGKTSVAGVSNPVGLGAQSAPWTENFPTKESLQNFTIIDVINDKNTWGYNTASNNVRCSSSFVNPKDDWLITPSVRLEAGKSYRIGIEAYSSKGYSETFDIRLGSSPTIEGMTNVVVPETSIKFGPEDAREFSEYITVPQTGNYYIGIHAFSPKMMFNLYVNRIFVDAPLEGKAPAKVGNLSVTPAADGSHTTEIKGIAPTTDLLGGSLSSLSSIVVKRGETVVKTLTGITPGNEFSYTDQVDTAGEYTYTVYATNSIGSGRPESSSVYVGVNIPAAVSNVVIKESSTPGTVEISWTAPTLDIAGKPLPAGKFTYTLRNNGSPDVEEIISGLTSPSYTWKVNSGNIQDFAGVAVFAVSESGASEGSASALIPVGKPYSLPYLESFNNGSVNSLLGIQNIKGTAANLGWGIYKDGTFLEHDADGTNGYIVGKGKYNNDATMIFTGMIDLSQSANPAFSFYLYNLYGGPGKEDNNEVEVMIRVVGEESEWTSLRIGTVDNFCHGDTSVWRNVKTNLYAYRGKRVQLGLKAIVHTFTYTFIDALNVFEDFTDNLIVAGIEAPRQVNRDEEFNIALTLQNRGARAASGFNIHLYKNDNETPVATIAGGTLAPNTDSIYNFRQTLVLNDAEINSYTVKVEYTADQDQSDNQSDTITVKKQVSKKGVPTNLEVTENQSHNAVLTWISPDAGQETESVLEDFESYPSFATSGIGDWTFVDGDKKPVAGPWGITIPGISSGSLLSYLLFDCSGNEFSKDAFKALSGHKYIASLSRQDYGKVDDWAISPRLSGNKQTIKFYAKSYSNSYKESIELLYSTTDTDTASFVTVQSEANIPATWTEYTFEVPAGAKYFAIRTVTKVGEMLCIDDVTFEQKYDKPIGFNIYRDGIKINDTPVTGTTFTDTSTVSGSHTYCVTAVYANDESEASNLVAITLGAGMVLSDIHIHTEPGNIVITGAEDKYVSVTEINGRVLYTGKPGNILKVPASTGVHIVRVATNSYKVMVP